MILRRSQEKEHGANVHILFYAGMDNQEHYFVATQDKALRVALGKLPGGASVFVNVNGVQMEQPSEAQKRAMKQVTAVFSSSLLLQIFQWSRTRYVKHHLNYCSPVSWILACCSLLLMQYANLQNDPSTFFRFQNQFAVGNTFKGFLLLGLL